MKAEVEIEENEDALAKHCVNIDIEQIFGVMLIAAFLALSERATREDYSDKGKEEDKWSCGGKVCKKQSCSYITCKENASKVFLLSKQYNYNCTM